MFARMMKVFVVVVVVVTLGGAKILYAHGDPASFGHSHHEKDDGCGGFMYGLNRIDLGDLGTKLKASGFEEFEDNFTFYGGSGYGVAGEHKIIIGGEGGGFSQNAISANQKGQKASLSGGYGLFNVGYIVFSKKNFRLFPLLGLGGGGLSLKIWETTGSAPTFDKILDGTEPKREVSMSTGGLLFNLALGADYLLVFGGDKEGEGGLLFGLRAGYILSPGKADWEMEDVDVSGGSDVRITGPYLRLVLGGGGRDK
ncbi:MAG: hypothetical protein QME81_00030 [bacterium]|nr:hypothetical protein [bacterium]